MNRGNFNVENEMYYSDLWIKLCKKSREVILDNHKIKEYNKENLKKLYTNDIFNVKDKMNRNEIIDIINKISIIPKVDRYKEGNLITKEYYDKLYANLNLEGLEEEISLGYGILVKRGELRTFPSSDRVFKNHKDCDLDRFMETAVYPAEPCIIYATSKDGNWYFCKIYNYCGWINKENIAIGSKDEIMNYCNCEDFIVVIGKKINFGYNPWIKDLQELYIDMGVKLPIEKQWDRERLVHDMYSEGNYVVKYPQRDCEGKLKFINLLVPFNEQVHEGYLKCTRGNILKQIFKFQGERYGWGGEFQSRDCSSLIIDTFRCFGINLPRNSGDQLRHSVGKSVIFDEEVSYDEKIKILENLKPGALIFLDGHVCMFIGKCKEGLFIIHDTIGVYVDNNIKENFMERDQKYGDGDNLSSDKIYLNIKGVTISNLKGIYTSNGNSYIDSIIGVKDILI
ncbi:MAG: SH3 domain-containing protein [Clostridium sp.]